VGHFGFQLFQFFTKKMMQVVDLQGNGFSLTETARSSRLLHRGGGWQSGFYWEVWEMSTKLRKNSSLWEGSNPVFPDFTRCFEKSFHGTSVPFGSQSSGWSDSSAVKLYRGNEEFIRPAEKSSVTPRLLIILKQDLGQLTFVQ
jgi:hypothetical protein